MFATAYTSGNTMTIENCIVRNGVIANSVSAGVTNLNVYQNTFICETAQSYLLNLAIAAGSTMNCNFQNNLILAPRSTYIINQTTGAGTLNFVESGNIYVAVNSDAKLPSSTRYTSPYKDLMSTELEYKDDDGVKRYYVKPRGTAINACTRLLSLTDDYLGKTRGTTTDCGAIDTEGI